MPPEPLANSDPRPSLSKALFRGWRLRCPVCGEGRLFESWLRMRDHCPSCGLKLQRGPGYYLGSIYINYGLTAILVTGGYLALFFTDTLSPTMRLVLLGIFCLLFPVWFFRYARSLWLAMDLYFDPDRVNDRA